MQLGALKVFCDVARYRSFSRAAGVNDITQSAVSQIVSHLEDHLQVMLVDRSIRPLQLTEAGQSYYEGLAALLDQMTQLEAQVRQRTADIAGQVQLAAIYSVGFRDMSKYEQRFRVRHPKADVTISYCHPDQVYARVVEGTADLGLVSFPRKTAVIGTRPWREEDMVLACAPTHPFASLATVKPDQLQDVPFVQFDRNLIIRRKVDRFFRDHKIAVRVVQEFDNIDSIKQSISEGLGLALLPEPTVRREVHAGSLAALSLAGCRMTRPLGVIYARKRRMRAAAQQFFDLLLEPAVDAADNGHATPMPRKTRRAKSKRNPRPN